MAMLLRPLVMPMLLTFCSSYAPARVPSQGEPVSSSPHAPAITSAGAYLDSSVVGGRTTRDYGLKVVFILGSSDSVQSGNTFRAESLWVIRGSEIWSAGRPRDLGSWPSSRRRYMATNGPLWEVGSTVEILVVAADLEGRSYRLRAPSTKVQVVR